MRRGAGLAAQTYADIRPSTEANNKKRWKGLKCGTMWELANTRRTSAAQCPCRSDWCLFCHSLAARQHGCCSWQVSAYLMSGPVCRVPCCLGRQGAGSFLFGGARCGRCRRGLTGSWILGCGHEPGRGEASVTGCNRR